MRINFLPHINFQSRMPQKPFGVRLCALEYDTVSFSGRKPKDNLQRISVVPEEDFPSKELREYMLNEAKKPENKEKTPRDFHMEYFSKLFECENLEEAKEIYPAEFGEIIDGKELYASETSPRKSVLAKIDDGEFEGLNIENITLKLLQEYYGTAEKVAENGEGFFGIKATTLNRLLDRMNIKMGREYRKLISSALAQSAMREVWKTEPYRSRMDEVFQSEEWRAQKQKTAVEMWNREGFREAMAEMRQTEEYKQQKAEAMKKNWNDEKTRKKILDGLHSEECRQKKSEAANRNWADEDFRAKMEEIHKSEEYRKKQSDTAYANWNNEEFRKARMSKEYRQKRSQIAKDLWQTEDYQEKMKNRGKKA